VEEFTAEHGELAYVVLSMKDYENLAINIADLRRYIKQQTEIIVYYEEADKPGADNTTDKKLFEKGQLRSQARSPSNYRRRR